MELLYRGWQVKELQEHVRAKEMQPITNMPANVMASPRLGMSTYTVATLAGSTLWEDRPEARLTLFVERVAKTHPHFNYCVLDIIGWSNSGDGACYFKHVVVMDKTNTPLGEIQLRSDSCRLDFQNLRVERDTHNRDYRHTTSLASAKKLFKKYFFSETPREKVNEAGEDIKRRMRKDKHSLKMTMERDALAILAFIKSNITSPVLADAVAQLGRPELCSSLVDSTTNYTLAETMHTESGHGAAVSELGGMYAVATAEGYVVQKVDRRDRAVAIATPDLSERMRQALGLLKLSEAGSFVEGVGFKAAEGKFYLAVETNDGKT